MRATRFAPANGLSSGTCCAGIHTEEWAYDRGGSPRCKRPLAMNPETLSAGAGDEPVGQRKMHGACLSCTLNRGLTILPSG